MISFKPAPFGKAITITINGVTKKVAPPIKQHSGSLYWGFHKEKEGMSLEELVSVVVVIVGNIILWGWF